MSHPSSHDVVTRQELHDAGWDYWTMKNHTLSLKLQEIQNFINDVKSPESEEDRDSLEKVLEEEAQLEAQLKKIQQRLTDLIPMMQKCPDAPNHTVSHKHGVITYDMSKYYDYETITPQIQAAIDEDKSHFQKDD